MPIKQTATRPSEPDLQHCTPCQGCSWNAIQVGPSSYDVFVIRLGDVGYFNDSPAWMATVYNPTFRPVVVFFDGDLAVHDGADDEEVALAAVSAALQRQPHHRRPLL